MRDTTSPTVTLLFLVVGVSAVQGSLWLFGVSPRVFALAWPLDHRPWTLLTSVFAHAGLEHLLRNLIGLAILGALLERRTSATRLYLFFVLTGVLAGVMQVAVATLVFGQRAIVLGASGAIFGLFGYVLTGNRLTEFVAAGIEIRPRVQLFVVLLIAVVLTVVTAGERAALIAHFTGLLIGLVAGREHLLRPSPSRTRGRDIEDQP